MKENLWLILWLPDSPRHGVNQAVNLFTMLFASQPGIGVGKACYMRVAESAVAFSYHSKYFCTDKAYFPVKTIVWPSL